MNGETIDGFDIPKRKLTIEEKTRDLSLDRFNEWHSAAGEDFVDQVGHTINPNIFGGYLLAKFPHLSSQILLSLNGREGVNDLRNIINDDNVFYSTLSEFANLTEALKGRLNQILIQVVEYYKN